MKTQKMYASRLAASQVHREWAGYVCLELAHKLWHRFWEKMLIKSSNPLHSMPNFMTDSKPMWNGLADATAGSPRPMFAAVAGGCDGSPPLLLVGDGKRMEAACLWATVSNI